MSPANKVTLALCLMAIASAIIGFVVDRAVTRRMKRAELRHLVFANLDSARLHGYFRPGELLHNATPEELAYELTLYAEGLDDKDPDTLLTYVREWVQLSVPTPEYVK